ncbi:hypothetical protein Vretimale_10583, partial [Volvox reticuliferus]
VFSFLTYFPCIYTTTTITLGSDTSYAVYSQFFGSHYLLINLSLKVLTTDVISQSIGVIIRPHITRTHGLVCRRYRAHIRLTVQLIDDKDELMSPMRLPFVAAVVQKGSGFKYHVRTPRENYLIALNGRDTFAEGSFLIWGSRSAISRFISIFIVLVMWLLSIIVFTQALYTVWYRKFDNSIEMATFTTALLFALPQLRNAQPGIPTEANLVIDMTGFIWNMALVSISCIIYIWSFYSKVVTHRRRSAKTSSKLQQQVPIVGDDDEVPPPMEEKQQEYAAGAGADDDVEETELNLAHSAPPVTVRSTNNIDDASSKQA